MKYLSIAVIAAFLLMTVPATAQQKMESSKKEFTGYLVDKMCGSTMSKKSADKAMASAAKHTKACATEEACAASGYGIMFDGTWHAFDESGNKKAAEFLASTKAKDHLYIGVTGSMNNDVIVVASLHGEKEPSSKPAKSGMMKPKK